ncbi:PUR family DNA/RNA-binding protein [Treponema pedis]|uniref:PUR family DNA/RNA-binding protein n=1 Tax=Treponema pedis TaxID=409322 RepID=A0A7S6WNL6_9SPIR|nr:PUR family DNA/RNA-binding protein [Treponema pedis]QOW60309.1 PUR family DNA/RNA-binding protein [Treponema pedis]
MGIRGELFTTQIPAENRTYFFNVKENTKGDVFLQIVESKASEGVGFDRHAVVIFEDEMRAFLQGLDKSIEFIEKNRKEKIKAKKNAESKKIGAEKSSGKIFLNREKQKNFSDKKMRIKKIVKKRDDFEKK